MALFELKAVGDKPLAKPALETGQVQRNQKEPAIGAAYRDSALYGTDDLFKAYIPNFLYKPPYGFPRRVDTEALKRLAANPYVYAVIKTLADEASGVDWEVRVKEDFNDDGNDYSEKQKEITKFFNNPNGNQESFENLVRTLIVGILEVDAGLIVKVFNRQGEMKHIFARDGSLFLKNPDIYGYIGNRANFVPPLPDGFAGIRVDLGGTPSPSQLQLMNQYNILYRQQAAYFQYGFTAGSFPIPFGKREVVYIMQNPRPDSIYGRSPIEVLATIINDLVYGSELSLDYYTRNNMPDGAIQLIGAQQEQIQQFRENWESKFKFTDANGTSRKKFYTYPISSEEVKFTAFQLTPADIELIAQQEWFTKILWMCFGVTANEMGFTETVNKSVGEEQTKLAKRKALKPILDILAYHLNTEVLPEFYVQTTGPEKGMPLAFSEIPIEFAWTDYDLEEDKAKHDMLEQELRMGVKSIEMAARELGIDIDEVTKDQSTSGMGGIAPNETDKQTGPEDVQDTSENQDPGKTRIDKFPPKEKITPDNPVQAKSAVLGGPDQEENEVKTPTKKQVKKTVNSVRKQAESEFRDLDKEIDEIGKNILDAFDNIPENQFQLAKHE